MSTWNVPPRINMLKTYQICWSCHLLRFWWCVWCWLKCMTKQSMFSCFQAVELTQSLTQSLSHSVTQSLSHSLTHSLVRSLAHCIHPSVRPSIRPSVRPSIYQYISLSIYSSIHPHYASFPTRLCINRLYIIVSRLLKSVILTYNILSWSPGNCKEVNTELWQNETCVANI